MFFIFQKALKKLENFRDFVYTLLRCLYPSGWNAFKITSFVQKLKLNRPQGYNEETRFLQKTKRTLLNYNNGRPLLTDVIIKRVQLFPPSTVLIACIRACMLLYTAPAGRDTATRVIFVQPSAINFYERSHISVNEKKFR